jgi:uncharacterized protein YggE
MKLPTLVLAALVASSAAWGGTISVTASGHASSPAEYIGINVVVHSKCYKKSQEALTENSKLSNEVLAVLKTYVTPQAEAQLKNVLTAVGGFFVRQTETIYKNNQTQVLCENGWRTAKYISLKLLDVDKVAEVQDAVLALVDARGEVADSGDPQTWADFSNPVASLTPEAEQKLSDKAIKDAIANARSELASVVSECAIRGAHLTDMRAPGGGPVAPASITEKAMGDSGGATAPYLFGELTASVTRVFTFTFEESQNCRR